MVTLSLVSQSNMLDILLRVCFSAAKMVLFTSKMWTFRHPKLNISVNFSGLIEYARLFRTSCGFLQLKCEDIKLISLISSHFSCRKPQDVRNNRAYSISPEKLTEILSLGCRKVHILLVNNTILAAEKHTLRSMSSIFD